MELCRSVKWFSNQAKHDLHMLRRFTLARMSSWFTACGPTRKAREAGSTYDLHRGRLARLEVQVKGPRFSGLIRGCSRQKNRQKALVGKVLSGARGWKARVGTSGQED